MSQPLRYSIIDTETTGLKAAEHKIIEIAIINMDGDKVVDRFETLINPQRKINSWISNITGINDSMVQNAPPFYQVAKKIVKMTEGRVFVAHNARFDFEFLKHEFAELGYGFRTKSLCTVRLARKAFPGLKSYSLPQLTEKLNILHDSKHRAMADAEATARLFQLIQNKLGSSLETGHSFVAPPMLDLKTLEHLPETTGVYFFYDQNSNPIYVGKSKNIKNRVRTHLSTSYKGTKALAFQNMIAKIDYLETGSELLSLILESDKIKTYSPYFNRSQKRRIYRYGVYFNEAYQLSISTLKHSYDFLKVFSSKRSAEAFIKMIEEKYSLDLLSEPALKKEIFQTIQKNFQYPLKDFYLVDKGRSADEKCVFVFRDFQFVGYYYLYESASLNDSHINYIKDNQDIKNIIIGEIARRNLNIISV